MAAKEIVSPALVSQEQETCSGERNQIYQRMGKVAEALIKLTKTKASLEASTRQGDDFQKQVKTLGEWMAGAAFTLENGDLLELYNDENFIKEETSNFMMGMLGSADFWEAKEAEEKRQKEAAEMFRKEAEKKLRKEKHEKGLRVSRKKGQDLPFILAMGSSGVGKSSLLNALLEEPQAFGVAENARAGATFPKVVEKEGDFIVMDSGGFADPDQRDAEIGQMLYQQFKDTGTPTTILLCSSVVRYDETCQKVMNFLRRVFGDVALTRIVFVLTQQNLGDRALTIHERKRSRQPPRQLDNRSRDDIIQMWRKELATELNAMVNEKHVWLQATAQVPVFILDSHVKL